MNDFPTWCVVLAAAGTISNGWGMVCFARAKVTLERARGVLDDARYEREIAARDRYDARQARLNARQQPPAVPKEKR